MELTQQDKARIFAMYLGSDINTSINGTVLDCDWLEQIIERDCDAQLILKDLSDITDEDAIEVAAMNYPDAYDSNTNADLAELGIKISKRVLDQTLCCENAVDTIDYLRSKSYMLPYKGINLFDAGIAIRKTITITQ